VPKQATPAGEAEEEEEAEEEVEVVVEVVYECASDVSHVSTPARARGASAARKRRSAGCLGAVARLAARWCWSASAGDAAEGKMVGRSAEEAWVESLLAASASWCCRTASATRLAAGTSITAPMSATERGRSAWSQCGASRAGAA
jgi:hypothetical protein